MTSLQKQLAAIAATASNELDLKAQKSSYSKSLLFDPHVAANQSLDTLYQICYEGFDELCAVDARFVPFQRTIFNIQSLKEDRLRMTTKENEELDNVIDGFLTLIGSRLLLKPAIKAVEWLIRKFRIHEYNTVLTVITFLPYHMTSIFPTLLSILPKRLDPSLRFLHPYINSLSNPPRSAIIYSAIHNLNLFKRINDFVLKASRAKASYHTLISFWATVVTQTIDGMLNTTQSGRLHIQQQREEDLLSLVLPVLQDGLTQKKSSELVLGCYMIITVLCHKVTLNDSVIDALVSAVALSWTYETCGAGLGCIAVLADHKQYPMLPTVALKVLSRSEDLGQKIQTLQNVQPVQKLCIGCITGFVDRFLETGAPDDLEVIKDLFGRQIIGEALKTVIRNSVLLKSGSDEPERFGQVMSVLADDETFNSTEYIESNAMEDIDTLHDAADLAHITQMNLETPDSATSGQAYTTQFLSCLSECEDDSYISHRSTENFSNATSAFSQSVNSSTGSRDSILLGIRSYFESNLASKLRLLTFLIRFINEDRSIRNRIFAFQLLAECLKSTPPAGQRYHEALFPYLLVKLADPSHKIRQLAGDSLLLVFGTVHSQAAAATESKRSNSIVRSFNENPSIEPHLISQRDLGKLLQLHLIPSLEECIGDKDHVGLLMSNAIDGHSVSEKEGPKASDNHLKSALRKGIFEYLKAYMLHIDIIPVKLALISVLNRVEKVAHEHRSEILKSLFEFWYSGRAMETQIAMEHEICKFAHPRDTESLETLLSLLREQSCEMRPELGSAAIARLQSIWNQMKSSTQNVMAKQLMQFSLLSHPSQSDQILRRDWQDESIQLLRNIKVSPSVIQAFIDECVKEMDKLHLTGFTNKRRRTNNGVLAEGTNIPRETKTLFAKITLTLELMDNSKHELGIELLYSLCRLLEAFQEYRNHTSADLGYLQTLTLDHMSSLMEKSKLQNSQKLDTSIVRADLLVDCAKSTSSSQVRNSALLLLSRLAKEVPQTVLQSVMPIFTLMSDSTVRQSDDFSAHVVDETIQIVIPLLARTIREQKRDLIPATSEILLSFAAAFDHIPTHRRFRLFSLLATSLGAGECMYAIIASLVDRFPSSKEVSKFSARLMRNFSALESLTTIKNYLDLCLAYFEKPEVYQLLIKQSANHSSDENSVENLLSVFSATLQDEGLQRLFLQFYDSEPADITSCSVLLSQALERVMKLSSRAFNSISLKPLCSKMLESLLHLFQFSQFTESIGFLLDTADEDICRSLIRTLEVRISSNTLGSQSSRSGAITLMPKLTKIMEDGNKKSLFPNVLACIDQICCNFGKLDLDSILHAASTIAGQNGIGSADIMVRSLSLHCLSSCIEVLGTMSIPFLQKIWQTAYEILQDESSASMTDSTLPNATNAILSSVVTKLPFMVTKEWYTPLLEVLLATVSSLSTRELEENRKQFHRICASHLEPDVLFASIRDTWSSAVHCGSAAVQDHLLLLKAALLHHKKSTIHQNKSILFNFYMDSFDLRRVTNAQHTTTKFSDQEIQQLEQAVIDTLMSMVLKIDDTTFRPFFTQLVEWCNVKPGKNNSTDISLRWITFSKFLAALSEKLKSIVTNYFSYVLDQYANLLKIHTSSKDSDLRLLVSSILLTLTSAFQHDQDDFWQNPSHFDVIMSPLIDQLGAQSSAQATVEVIPAVRELAVAAGSPEHHKTMNTAIIKLLRSDNPRTRLAAVKCQQTLTVRLGDEWLANLPEMLPIINELQEDDDEMVETQTHKWIKSIEDVLGESLNAMLQ